MLVIFFPGKTILLPTNCWYIIICFSRSMWIYLEILYISKRLEIFNILEVQFLKKNYVYISNQILCRKFKYPHVAHPMTEVTARATSNPIMNAPHNILHDSEMS